MSTPGLVGCHQATLRVGQVVIVTSNQVPCNGAGKSKNNNNIITLSSTANVTPKSLYMYMLLLSSLNIGHLFVAAVFEVS